MKQKRKKLTKLEALIDDAYVAWAFVRSYGNRLAGMNAEIARRAARRRNDLPSVQLRGPRSTCTVVWQNRVEWDPRILTAVRRRMGRSFDSLFRIEYSPTDSLEEFLRDGSPKARAFRRAIKRAEFVKPCQPAVRHRALERAE